MTAVKKNKEEVKLGIVFDKFVVIGFGVAILLLAWRLGSVIDSQNRIYRTQNRIKEAQNIMGQTFFRNHEEMQAALKLLSGHKVRETRDGPFTSPDPEIWPPNGARKRLHDTLEGLAGDFGPHEPVPTDPKKKTKTAGIKMEGDIILPKSAIIRAHSYCMEICESLFSDDNHCRQRCDRVANHLLHF